MRLRLFFRRAETPEGNQTLRLAFRLSCQKQYAHLTDADLIRLAYWGTTKPLS